MAIKGDYVIAMIKMRCFNDCSRLNEERDIRVPTPCRIIEAFVAGRSKEHFYLVSSYLFRGEVIVTSDLITKEMTPEEIFAYEMGT